MKKVFTLTELLIVICIIIILMTLLLPVLVRVKEKAQGITCLNHFRQIGTYFVFYSNDYNAFYPAVRGNDLVYLFGDANYFWTCHGLPKLMMLYDKKKNEIPGAGSVKIRKMKKGIFTCPAYLPMITDSTPIQSMGYGMSIGLPPFSGGSFNERVAHAINPLQIKVPSSAPLCGDAFRSGTSISRDWHINYGDYFSYDHSLNASVLFSDSHAALFNRAMIKKNYMQIGSNKIW